MDGQVFREVAFTFNGREVRLVPSVKMLRAIKTDGINVLALAQQCMTGGADALDLAIVLRHMLRHADRDLPEEERRKLTDDESYLWFASGKVAEVVSFQKAYIQAVMPGIDLGKKPAAPSKGKGKTKKPGPT